MATSESQKWACILVAGLIFLLVSAPFTYYATNFVGTKINENLNTEDAGGKPTLGGLILHLIVFMLLLRLSMFIPYEKFA